MTTRASPGNPRVYYSADMSSWSGPANQLPIGKVTSFTYSGDNVARGCIIELNGTIYAFIFDNASTGSEIEVLSTADEGATAWTAVAQISSATGPTGWATWRDLSGDVAPVIGTAEGVWALDTSAGVMQKLLSMPVDTNNCIGMFEANGKLYVPTGKGGMYELSMPLAGIVSARIMEFPGPDGLIAAKQGYVTGPVALSDRWAFIPYGGYEAGKRASILAYDLLSYSLYGRDVTHSIYYHGAANELLMFCALSGRDDGTMRLHTGARTGGSATDERFFAAPLTNPASGATISYETTGYLEIAEDDMGDPHTNGVVYQALLDADDLTASDETAVWKYGADGAAWDNATGGTFTDTVSSITLGSNLGVAAKTLRNRQDLTRAAGTATNTPKGKDFEWRTYKNLSAGKLGWLIAIDLEATATGLERDTEQVISDIETVLRSGPSVAFEYGKSGERYVRAIPGRIGEHSVEGERLREEARRTGVAFVQLEEIV